MTDVGAEWWGGRLADGSLVVLSPTGNALFLGDTSSSSGLQPGVSRRRRASSIKGWLGVRTGLAIPYERGGGHVVGIRRGTLLISVAFLYAIIWTVTEVVEGRMHLDPFTLPWAVTTLGLGLLSTPLLILLIYLIEVVPLKRRGVRFIDIEEDNDDYLRYVHPVVAATDEWRVLVGVAREHAPPSPHSAEVHTLLWETAGIKPTLDAGEIRPSDQERLHENTLLARGL